MKEFAFTLSFQTPHEEKDYVSKFDEMRKEGSIELCVRHTGESRGVHYHGIVWFPDEYKYNQLYDHGKDGMNVEIKRLIDKYGWIKYCYHEQMVYKDFSKKSFDPASAVKKGLTPGVSDLILRIRKAGQTKRKNNLAYILNLKIFN